MKSLEFLREPSYKIRGEMWFEDDDASQILMKGILDTFIEGSGRFPGLATPAIRCATLDIISQLAPHLNGYHGPNIRVYIRYALLTAKVLGRDTGDLVKARMKFDQTTGLDWESMPEDEIRIKSEERKRNIKTPWVYTGGIFTEAVLELASLEGCYSEKFIMNFVRTCRESYGEGRGTKNFSSRINDTEWTAAQTGDTKQQRPIGKSWFSICRKKHGSHWRLAQGIDEDPTHWVYETGIIQQFCLDLQEADRSAEVNCILSCQSEPAYDDIVEERN